MPERNSPGFQLGSEQEDEAGIMPMSAADRTIQAVVWSPTRDEFAGSAAAQLFTDFYMYFVFSQQMNPFSSYFVFLNSDV